MFLQCLRVPKFDMNAAKKLALLKTIKGIFLYFKIILFFLRNLLMDSHGAARGAPREAAAESGQSASGRGGEVLLMVEEPEHRNSSNETVLRTLDELQPGGTVNYVIPYRGHCAYILFQGERARLGLLSSRLFLNKLAFARFP